MKTLFTREIHHLSAGQLLSGVAHQARSLQVLRGDVWLTIEGELDDYWLASGDTLVLPAGRTIVLEANQAGGTVKTQLDSDSRASFLMRWFGQWLQRGTLQANARAACQN